MNETSSYEDGLRIYPTHPVAAVIVWCIDMLPESVRAQILKSWWSPEDMATVEREAKELCELFGVQVPDEELQKVQAERWKAK